MLFSFTQDYSVYESLATVYSEIGDHNKSINILEKMIEQMWDLYGLDNKPFPLLSIPYAHLCVAHYYNGDRDKAYQNIKRSMECMDRTPPSKGSYRA